MWRILRIPTMWWLILSGALFNFNYYAIGTFLPAFLSRYHGLSLKESNGVAALVFGAVGIPGLVLGGWAADHASRRAPNGRLMLASLALLVAAPCTYQALARPAGDLVGFSVLMAIGCLLGYVYYSGVYAAIQDVVQPSLRSTAMAVYFFAMYLLGRSFGPVLTGRLSDQVARSAALSVGATTISEAFRAAGLHSAMYVIPLCNLLLARILFAAGLAVTRDMDELEAWMAGSEKQTALAATADGTP